MCIRDRLYKKNIIPHFYNLKESCLDENSIRFLKEIPKSLISSLSSISLKISCIYSKRFSLLSVAIEKVLALLIVCLSLYFIFIEIVFVRQFLDFRRLYAISKTSSNFLLISSSEFNGKEYVFSAPTEWVGLS